MKKDSSILQEAGKYCLDISKLVFGGVILSGIMKNEIENYLTFFLTGGLVFLILIIAGFRLLNMHNKRRRK